MGHQNAIHILIHKDLPISAQIAAVAGAIKDKFRIDSLVKLERVTRIGDQITYTYGPM